MLWFGGWRVALLPPIHVVGVGLAQARLSGCACDPGLTLNSVTHGGPEAREPVTEQGRRNRPSHAGTGRGRNPVGRSDGRLRVGRDGFPVARLVPAGVGTWGRTRHGLGAVTELAGGWGHRPSRWERPTRWNRQNLPLGACVPGEGDAVGTPVSGYVPDGGRFVGDEWVSLWPAQDAERAAGDTGLGLPGDGRLVQRLPGPLNDPEPDVRLPASAAPRDAAGDGTP